MRTTRPGCGRASFPAIPTPPSPAAIRMSPGTYPMARWGFRYGITKWHPRFKEVQEQIGELRPLVPWQVLLFFV